MSKTFVHYDHDDPCKNARWTARECYQFMYCGRPWELINRFYLNAVNNMNRNLDNTDTFIDLLLKRKTNNNGIQVPQSQTHSGRDDFSGRWARLTFKIILSYHGTSFDGWQKQPGLHTVQSVVESSLGKFVDEKKAQLLQSKGLPIEASAVVAGRTDKGVTSLQQVCSFYTWRKDVQSQDIEIAINNAAPGKIRVVSVSQEASYLVQVSRDFHPNFSAEWRRYLYIFPLNDRENLDQDEGNLVSSLAFTSNACRGKHSGSCKSTMDNTLDVDVDCKDETDNMVKPYSFSVRRINQLLQQLEGKLLSYKLFARDTKASRNIGPPTECFVYHARAAETRLPVPDHGEGIRVMCVELVANRFLRKMVRVLVATSIREAAAGAEEDALIKLMDATCRRATAPPAPPDGLCLVDVGYGAFTANSCLIPKE